MSNDGGAGLLACAGLATTCVYCLIGILGITHTALNIAAVVASAGSDVMDVDEGKTYYLILPIISTLLPNPITTGLSAFTDCTYFNNCDASYRSLYTAAFGINITTVVLAFAVCFVLCCCVRSI